MTQKLYLWENKLHKGTQNIHQNPGLKCNYIVFEVYLSISISILLPLCSTTWETVLAVRDLDR